MEFYRVPCMSYILVLPLRTACDAFDIVSYYCSNVATVLSSTCGHLQSSSLMLAKSGQFYLLRITF